MSSQRHHDPNSRPDHCVIDCGPRRQSIPDVKQNRLRKADPRPRPGRRTHLRQEFAFEEASICEEPPSPDFDTALEFLKRPQDLVQAHASLALSVVGLLWMEVSSEALVHDLPFLREISGGTQHLPCIRREIADT